MMVIYDANNDYENITIMVERQLENIVQLHIAKRIYGIAILFSKV